MQLELDLCEVLPVPDVIVWEGDLLQVMDVLDHNDSMYARLESWEAFDDAEGWEATGEGWEACETVDVFTSGRGVHVVSLGVMQ